MRVLAVADALDFESSNAVDACADAGAGDGWVPDQMRVAC